MTRHEVRSVDRRDQHGFALVFLAVTLTVLMAMAGFAVDVGRWYYVGQHEQKAADAAALAGVVYLPQSVTPGNPAYDRALALAKANGFSTGITISAVPNTPTQLQVSVQSTVRNSFAGIVGYTSQSITRTAIAEYEAPVSMGSPAAIFGNEPYNINIEGKAWNNVSSFQPNTWANVMGPHEPKQNGDARQGGDCSGSSDGCVMPGTSNAGDNLDYSSDGYLYKVAVPPAEAAAAALNGYKLAIEVFDPEMAYVGDHCDQGNLYVAAGLKSTGGVSAQGPAANPYTSASDAPVRYAAGDTSNAGTATNTDDNGLWCTGDNFGGSGATPPFTSVIVHQDISPFSPATTPAVQAGGCAGQQFGYWTVPAGGWYSILNQASGTYDPGFARVFRQWVPVCIFDPSAQPAGDYIVQIRTNVPAFTASDQADMAQRFSVSAGTNNVSGGSAGFSTLPNTGGSNRLAIRAGWVQGTAGSYGTTFPGKSGPVAINQFSGANPIANTFVGGYDLLPPSAFVSSNLSAPAPGISISASNYMGLYANVAPGAAAPNYYMARVLPGGSGQTLEVRLWDIGDGAGAGTTLTFTLVDKPVGCLAHLHDGPQNNGRATAALVSTVGSSCSFDVFAGGTPNGGWITIDIPIPSSYSCNSAVSTDCWVKMKYVPVGGALNDTTTWGAQLLGNPVRLVK